MWLNNGVEESILFKNKDELDHYFINFYNRFSKFVFRKVYNKISCKEDAKDVTAEVFVIMYKQLDTIKHEEAIYQYLLTIISRTIGKYYEKNKIKLISYEEKLDSSYTYNIDDCLLILDCLSELEKNLIVLRVYYGLTFREIAKILDISLGNVHKQYNIAKDNLYKILKGKEE